MRNRLLSLLTSLALAAALVGAGVATSSPAHASTGGTADGDAHPYVGLILFYDADGRYRCSASLVTPTVLLTAAHCTDGQVGKTLVDFSSVVAEAPPSPYKAAADPAAGYTQAEIEAMGYVSGTAYTDPDYSHFTDMANWNDVGVIVLDTPVTDIPRASLATAGTADAIKQPRKTIFTAVGYGTEVRMADDGTMKPTPMSYPLLRRYVDMPGQKIMPQIIQTNGNVNDTFGTGGTCFGDSGGPLLLGGQIIGVTSYGYTDNCRYIDGYQRVDLASIQAWLATFGV